MSATYPIWILAPRFETNLRRIPRFLPREYFPGRNSTLIDNYCIIKLTSVNHYFIIVIAYSVLNLFNFSNTSSQCSRNILRCQFDYFTFSLLRGHVGIWIPWIKVIGISRDKRHLHVFPIDHSFSSFFGFGIHLDLPFFYSSDLNKSFSFSSFPEVNEFCNWLILDPQPLNHFSNISC